MLRAMPKKPPPPVVVRTKPPFTPPDRTQTEAVYQTATQTVLAAEMTYTAQVEATLQAETTATAEAWAALATVTAAARNAEILAYDYYEPFDENTLDWREAVDDNPYWQGSISLQDGVYTWQVDRASQIFLAWSYFTVLEDLGDFDVALRARRVSGQPHETCYGMLFRTSPEGYEAGMYALTVCDEGYYKLLYFDAELGWEVIENWTPSEAIRSEDWNLLEISARGETFTLTINHQPVTTFRDSRLASGRVAILIDIYDDAPGQIDFDFFALQPQ
jgi:hypothetical protein